HPASDQCGRRPGGEPSHQLQTAAAGGDRRHAESPAMNLRDTPIRRKLTVVILATVMVAMVVMRIVFFTYEYLTFRQATLRQLSMFGEIIASNSTAALAFDNPEDAAEVMSALKVESHVSAACLYDRNNRLFATYPATLSAKDLPTAPGAPGYRFETGALIG